MPYLRTTRDEYWLMADYGCGHGWEHTTTEASPRDARAQLARYRQEAPQYRYRIIHKRITLKEKIHDDSPSLG